MKDQITKSTQHAMKVPASQKIAKLLLVTAIFIIVLMPFHGFFTTWAGSSIGGLLFWRAWKEFLLIGLVLLSIYLLIKDGDLRQRLLSKKNKFIWIALILVIWQVFRAIFSGDGFRASVLGLAIQTRALIFFGVVVIGSYYAKISKRLIVKIIIFPAILVTIFGILQMTVLPIDFLSIFGYEKNVTIPPFFTIDEQMDQIRIASTLRGPNPLGVYLILPILLLISHLISNIFHKSRKPEVSHYTKLFAVCFSLLALLAVLYGSHSRGAWLGLVAATGILMLLELTAKWRKFFIILGIVLIPVTIGAVYQFRDTRFVQDVVLHDNPEEGGNISSNQGHIESLKSGLSNVASDPIDGCGVGCAGPASVHSNEGVVLSENYFIQTAEESGLIGLALLLAVFLTVLIILYKNKDDYFAKVLLASFVGISVASLTAHAWADDTIAYIWWGIAGFYLYNEFVGKQNGKTKN